MLRTLTPDQQAALEVARSLASAGVPLFIARPDATAKTGYRPPAGWERTEPDPSVVDQWEPGLALCAVMGCGLDLLDFDPRNGGDPASLNGTAPQALGTAATPSGGVHWFVNSLGVGSRDNVLPGVDVKGGTPVGTGRGFAFLAPTVRASVVTGEQHPYHWTRPPDLSLLGPADGSGARLADRIRELRASTSAVRTVGGPAWWQAYLLSDEPQSTGAANHAIEAKLSEVAAWTAESDAGFRLTLLRAALTLGGYVGGGHLDATEAWQRLEDAVTTVWGGPDVEDRLWIQQGLDDGVLKPFYVYRESAELGDDAAAVVEVALNADRDPDGLLVHQHASEVDSLLWLLAELGVRGLAGTFRRGRHTLVHCSQIRDDTYVAAPGEDDDNGPATVRAVTGRMLQTRVAMRYLIWRWAGGQRNPHRIKVLMPMQVCEAVLTAVEDAPNVRPLRGVTHTPMVRRDGTILDVPGYDDATGYLFLPSVPVAPVPAEPSAEQTRAAVERIRGLVSEFAWAGPHDEANYLGLMLSPLLRLLCPPPFKLAAIMAHQPGSGKSLLAKVLREIHGGVFRSEMPADDAELAKSVTSILTQTTAPVVQFDNVTGVLRSSRLAGLLTSATYSDRVLGSTNNVDMDNDRLWTITGNNLALGGDLLRRTVWVTIDPQVPDPEKRTGFAIPDLAAHVTEHRGEILHALLTLVRAWVLAGRPMQTRSSDDYGRWSATVRGILSVAGVPGEFDHDDSRQQQVAVGDDDWRGFLEAVREAFGDSPWSVKELLGRVHDGRDAAMDPGNAYGREHPIPLDALPAELVEKLARVRAVTALAKSLGMWLRNREGRWAGNLTVRRAGEDGHSKVQLWRVESHGGGSPEPSGAGPIPSESIQNPDFAGSAVSAGSVSAVPTRKTQQSGSWNVFSSGNGGNQTPQSPQTPQDPGTGRTGHAGKINSAEADPDTITKAEARKRVTAERRAAAVAEAAGPVHGLPAAVDRSGTVVPLEATSALAAGHSAIARSGSLTVDVETSGYPVGHPDYALRSVQLGDDRIAIVWDPVVHADQIRELLAAAPRLHAHSATADLVPLALAGLTDAESAWERMHDTVIGAKLADPQSTGSDPGLKQLAGTVLGEHAVIPAAEADRAALFSAGKWLTNTKTDTPPERSGWAQVATGSTTMLRYAASDVLDTAALTRAVPAPDPRVLERERLVQRMTARVTHHGIRIDARHVAELSETHTAGRAAAGERVHAYGIDNPGSNPQVAKAMAELGADLPRTAKGAPSVAEAALKPLAQGEGPAAALAAAVLDYRHHDTVLGTFLEPYRLLCARGDGRARPTIYTLGTDTGRMSCVRPNLQQLPRAGGVRACLTADDGQLMIGADFSGVELRVAAALSQDPTLLRFLAEGRDLHAEVAGMVFGADAAKAERYRVKPMVFGRLYGGGVETLAAQGGVPVATAQAVIDALDALTPGLTAWSATIRNAVKRGHTQFPTYAGRIIHLPREYPHKAPNYCIQGTARELLVDTYTRWRDTPWGHCVSLPVHDELDVFVPENQAAEATAELVRCMETELYGVRIVADPSEPAYAWADST